MAPLSNVAIATVSSQQVLTQAAEKLSQAVNEVPSGPNEFAKALQELIELTTKIEEFDAVSAMANVPAANEEAQTWQEISMMTLQFCRMNLVDGQQKALKRVTELAERGASLNKMPNGVAVLPKPPTPLVVEPPGLQSKSKLAAPPGFFTSASQLPPGLGAPPGLAPPPGLEIPQAKKEQKKAPELPPWRKAAAAKAVAKAKEPVAPVEVTRNTETCFNFGAYSDGEDSD